jgi:hypothetical protein
MSGWTKGPDRGHPRERYCYDRRVAGSCSAPVLDQTRLEADVAEVLAAVALSAGFAEAVDAALATSEGTRGQHNRRASLTSIEARQARLSDLYELGDITRDDYVQRRARPVSRRSFVSGPPCDRSSTVGMT